MRKFFRHLFRTILIISVLCLATVLINMNTRFFKDIGTYIPYLQQRFPYLCQYIGELSDDVNSSISQLPTVGELLARIRNVELPIDPDDIASNIYYADDSMLTFNNKQNISVKTDGARLQAYGRIVNPREQHLVCQILDQNGTELVQKSGECDSEHEFMFELDIPDGAYQFTLFAGSEMYGEFRSLVYNYVYLSRSADSSWVTAIPMMLEHNTAKFEKAKSLKNALKRSYDISVNDDETAALARTITAGCETDYDKALAIHDWVCLNVYYDYDNLNSGNHIPYTSLDVLRDKRAVCLGFANLYAALCRSQGIPCNVVTGFAPEPDAEDFSWESSSMDFDTANHAWNEVHIDNRWVIVDTTWDSKNKIKNGQLISEGEISHLFFDANLRFFSVNHKIIEY